MIQRKDLKMGQIIREERSPFHAKVIKLYSDDFDIDDLDGSVKWALVKVFTWDTGSEADESETFTICAGDPDNGKMYIDHPKPVVKTMLTPGSEYLRKFSSLVLS